MSTCWQRRSSPAAEERREDRYRRRSPGLGWRSGGGLVQASGLSFLCHPIEGFPPLPAHAGLIGEKVGEHDAPVPAAPLIRDRAVLDQPYQRGSGDAEQFGGLLRGARIWRSGFRQAVTS
jgi:hypothetical protein